MDELRRFLKERTVPLLLLTVLTAAMLLFANRASGLPALRAVPGLGQEQAESALLGRSRQEVLAAWGDPDGTLSGLFGDIYTLDSGDLVIVYYDTEPMNQGTASHLTVPLQHILSGRLEKEGITS